MVRLAIIVPCYNEEEVLPETTRRLLALLSDLQKGGEISANSVLYFVNDGSFDRTWQCVEELASANPQVHGIKLSRNCGHQNALLAGLFAAPCDVAISIDADLQDDPEAMRGMLAARRGGTSFSVAQLRAIMWFGLIISIFSFAGGIGGL